MAIDAGIPLQGQPNFPTAQSLLGVSQAIEQMKDRQRMAQLAQRMQQYFTSNPDAIDHNTGIVTAKGINDLYAIDAGVGQRASEQRMKMLGQSAQVAATEQDTAFQKWDQTAKVMRDGMQRAYAKGTAIEGGDDSQKDKVANEDFQEYLTELDKSGMADRLGIDTNKYRQLQVKWDSLPYQMATLQEQQKIRKERLTHKLETGANKKPQEGTPLSGIADAGPEQQDTQTATGSGAQYRGAPPTEVQGTPLAEVGKTPQQEAATAEQGPTVQDPNVMRTTGGEPVLEVNVEGNPLPDKWLREARELENSAKAIEEGGGDTTRSQQLRKDAEDKRGKAIQMMREDRLASKTAKEQTLTNFMKEAAAVYGEGTPKYKKALEDHIKKMDAPPQWLAQTPERITAEQSKLSGKEFLDTLSPAEQTLVKGISEMTIDPNSVSTRNNQRQNILEKVLKYNPGYNQQDFKESQNAAVKFGSGPQGNAVRSFNVALEHLETLKTAARAMKNGDVQAINQARNEYRKQTGSDLPTNFEAVKQLVAAEVVKAIVGGGSAGALADREEAARTMIARSSPAQMEGVIEQMQHLFGGQLHGLEKQYSAATKRNDFRDRYLTPIGKRAAAAADADVGSTPDMRGSGGKSKPPAAGDVREYKGSKWKFKGGDPADQNSWEKQ